MCVIICLKDNQTIPFDKLKNATLNNPHGFGIVVPDGKTLDVFKDFNENGNDPELIARELEKRKGAETFLHLRYATIGEKSADNTHPFTVFKNTGHHIEFMHNGSMYSFKDTAVPEASDTRMFAINFLSPLLYKFKGDKGIADISDPLIAKILGQYFSTTNRGLLLSTKHDPLFLGTWGVLDIGDTTLKVSNNEYFNTIQTNRLTDYYKAKEYSFRSSTEEKTSVKSSTEKDFKEGETKDVEKATERRVVPLKDVNLSQTGRFLCPDDLDALYNSPIKELDDDTLAGVAMLSILEITTWVKANPDAASRLLETLACRLHDMFEDYEQLWEKKQRAEEHLRTINTQNKQEEIEMERARANA